MGNAWSFVTLMWGQKRGVAREIKRGGVNKHPLSSECEIVTNLHHHKPNT